MAERGPVSCLECGNQVVAALRASRGGHASLIVTGPLGATGRMAITGQDRPICRELAQISAECRETLPASSLASTGRQFAFGFRWLADLGRLEFVIAGVLGTSRLSAFARSLGLSPSLRNASVDDVG